MAAAHRLRLGTACARGSPDTVEQSSMQEDVSLARKVAKEILLFAPRDILEALTAKTLSDAERHRRRDVVFEFLRERGVP